MSESITSATKSSYVLATFDALSLIIPTLALVVILSYTTRCAGEKTRLHIITITGLLLLIISGVCRVALDFLTMPTEVGYS